MKRLKRYRARIVSLSVGALLVGYALLFAPPSSFPVGKIIVVKRGESVTELAATLAEAKLIAHPTAFRLALRLLGAGNTVQAGAYAFASEQNALWIAHRLGTGDYGIPPARITITEGMTVRDIAERVTEALPEVSAAELRAAGESSEGYLFPDTYVFAPGTDAESVVKVMRDTFDAKIQPLRGDIGLSGHSLADIVTMASLLEKEARTPETRRIIAGILWRRLAIGMPLQVDAVFGYIFARDTYSPSFTDLRVDSPYNTYTHKGLPPGPINNPGLGSIEAALHPTQTPYLFYLTGRDGEMHYAATYAGHQANQRKYLP